MNSKRAILGTIVAALVLFALVLTAISGGGGAVAAPMAIPTPVSVTRPVGDGYASFNPMTAEVIAEDTTSTCYDVAKYSVVDVLYSIDQTILASGANTVTLTSKWSIDGTTLVDGVNIVASNAADATDMAQLQTFGRYFCVLANVSNAQDVTVTVQAIAK